MTRPYPRLAGPLGGTHPVVLNRRLRELLVIGAAALLALALGLGISVAVPKPNFALFFALLLGAVGVVALVLNRRLEVSVTLLVLYLGLLEGPVKLGSGGHQLGSAVRDVLIFSVALGALLRLLASKERVRLPPLFGWVLAFVTLVLVEAFNPKTQGLLKALGGFRQQLEWVPFFFFGFVLMRSKERFRKFFIILGVIALANGMVSTYQARLTPGQLASWGPGYGELVYGTQQAGSNTGIGGRKYISEGVARVRPPGLGADAGFGGGVGAVAFPCALALLAIGGPRRRWFAVLLCLGALLAIVTGLGRFQVVAAVVGTVVFGALAMGVGRRVTRPLIAVAGVLILAIPAGAVLVSFEAKGTFSRYEQISPGNVTSSKDKKTTSLTHLPKQLEAAPFGVGLGTVGAAAGFGGKVTDLLEGHGVSAETQYNFVSDELGLPGLLLWIALSGMVIILAVRRLGHVQDPDVQIALAAVFAVIIAFTLAGVSGPTMASVAFGPFFWFATGIAAYWFVARRSSEPRAGLLGQAGSP